MMWSISCGYCSTCGKYYMLWLGSCSYMLWLGSCSYICYGLHLMGSYTCLMYVGFAPERLSAI